MSFDSSGIFTERLEKVANLKNAGINPYPNTFHRTHTNLEALDTLIKAEKDGKEPGGVTVAGRVVSRRDMGKLCFLDIRDSSQKIQLFCSAKNLSESSIFSLKNLDIGDFVGATGQLIRTRSGEPSVNTSNLVIINKSLQPLPEKWHGLQDTEKRHRQRYLDLISNPEGRNIFITRCSIISGIRNFLNNNGFLEVETPVLQSQACGAAARPFVTYHNALDQSMYLRIALELYLKRLLVGGFDGVYEIGRIFRNEGISVKHNPEFTMLECYKAYADYNDMMDLTEKMVSGIVEQIYGGYQAPYGDITLDFTPPWPRLDFRTLLLEKSGVDFLAYSDADGLRKKMIESGLEADVAKDKGQLIDELVAQFIEPNLVQPCFLIDYPIELSPLAKTKPGESGIVERFEAFAHGMEIANAFSELNDPQEQYLRFAQQLEGETQSQTDDTETIDRDFITALEYGMPPTGGLGIGIDRLVMLLTNQKSIREVILFPTLKTKE
jgi:lysyl-tRNA synthetase class 2